MKNKTPLFLLVAALSVASFNASAAALECAPQVQDLLKSNPTYAKLNKALSAKVSLLKSQQQAVSDQKSYEVLLATAVKLASSIQTGRVVITMPDGTVMVDTGKPIDPVGGQGTGNSYDHYKGKSVNENHNSRLSIINAQLHPCGVGVETKWSTSVKAKDVYVAIRLGNYLDSIGTARFSVTK